MNRASTKISLDIRKIMTQMGLKPHPEAKSKAACPEAAKVG